MKTTGRKQPVVASLINWHLPYEEMLKIKNVCIQYAFLVKKVVQVDMTQLEMDVVFVHKFRYKLDFQKMIEMEQIGHDIGGIHHKLNRETGELGTADLFVPRCTLKEYSTRKNPLRKAHWAVRRAHAIPKTEELQ